MLNVVLQLITYGIVSVSATKGGKRITNILSCLSPLMRVDDTQAKAIVVNAYRVTVGGFSSAWL